jgi:AcrR family transcriptional regulator
MTRAESRLITRNRLLAAGKEEFFQHGLAKANLRDILKRANVSAGAFYHHFDDKIDLFLAILQEAADICHRVFADAFAAPTQTDPVRWVKLMFTRLLEFGRDNRELLLILFRETQNGEPRVREFFRNDQEAHTRNTAENLKKLVDSNILPPVNYEWAAFLVVGFISGALNEQLSNPRADNEWLRATTLFVVGGLPAMAPPRVRV